VSKDENKIQRNPLPLPEPRARESGVSSKLASLEAGVQKPNSPWMEGALSLQVVGLQALWQTIWCTLTSKEITFSSRRGGNDGMKVLLQNVTKVQPISNYDVNGNYVFDIYNTERRPIRLAAKTKEERALWVKKISSAKGRDVADWTCCSLTGTEEDSEV
jgi:hypothetical protein